MSGLAWQVWVAWVVLWTAGCAATYALGWLAGREETYDRGYEDGLADGRVGESFWDEREAALEVFDFEK